MADAGRPAVLVADTVRHRGLPDSHRDAVAAHGGRNLNPAGDGLAIGFPSALAALAYAKEAQRGDDLGLRIGIEVEDRDDPDPSQTVASALAGSAELGQVLVSHAVHAVVVGSPGHEFRELGQVELGGHLGAIPVWELLWREPEPRTKIHLCGPLAVEIDGRDLAAALPGGQASSLLGYLAAKPDRAADRDELIDVLWPERPPADPHAALRPLLSRLRRALAPATLEGRERLRLALPEPVWIDLEEATRSIEAARADARSTLWASVREKSEAALELLRPGLLLAQDGEWLESRRREVEELELEALEWRARSSLALGAPELVAAERASRELVARAPYRETGYRFLMEALAANGNVAEALRVYDELRVLLREELGVAPAGDVQELHRRLLAGEPVWRAGAPEGSIPDRSRRASLPDLLSPRTRAAFVGREHELGLLHAAWQDARAGTRRLLLVVGEPGIGKTRLTSELALEAHDHGTVLYAGCQEEALLSYQPFVEAIRDYARSTGLDWSRLSLGPGVGELARLVPELAAALPGEPTTVADDRGHAVYLLFESISTFLVEASAHAPLLFVLDDLHWADRATLHLLRHVVRAAHGASLMIVGTYREGEIGADHPLPELLGDLRRDGLMERISLDGLDEDDVATLIASHAGHEASPGLVETVHERTEGNPYFVEEVMRHLIETGILYEREGRWVSARTLDEIGVPDGVKEVLVRRLGRLSESCRIALTHAAVLGREFSFDVLRSMADLDENALVSALEEADAAQLVVEGRGGDGTAYSFTHALVRETLYGGLSGPRRQRLHGRAASVLEDRHGLETGQPIVEIAYHLSEAAPVGADRDRAVTLAEQAAEWALERGGYEQAVALLTRALGLALPRDDERARRLTRTRAVAFQRLSHAAFDSRPTGG